MNELVSYINRAFAYLLDFLIWPLKSFSPIWSLAFISALAGVALLYFFGLISNQGAIRRTKQKIHAALLETVLFRHDIKLCLKAQGRMLKNGAVYFFLALIPLVVLSIPCVYLLGHLNTRYNARPLHVGERALVEVSLKDPAAISALSLSTADSVAKEVEVRATADNKIVYRLKPGADGSLNLALNDGEQKPLLTSSLIVGKAKGMLNAEGYSSWFWSLLYPGAEITGSAADKLSSVWIDYPEAEYKIFGIQSHWIVIFFVISLISGLVASRVMSIEI